MKTVNEMYRGSFFSKRYKLNWRIPFVCNAIKRVLYPNSLIDVGCAVGDYVKGFINRDIDAYGVEGSQNCLPYIMTSENRIYIKDIRKKVDIGKYDLAISLEVLEHIDAEYTDILISNLINMSNKILVSAAPPGQKGHYHVNCQPKVYWINKFAAYNYISDLHIVEKIKYEWEDVKCKKEMSAYYNNLMYFEKTIN